MKVALAQIKIKWEDKGANLLKAKKCIMEAKSRGAEIVLFPEMSLTGFSMNVEYTGESNNWTVDQIVSLAHEYSIYIGIGWVEKVGKKGRNHYTIVDYRGNIQLDYIKIHPFSYAKENCYFEAGNRIYDFSFAGYTWSSLICYDLRFPELFQIASEEADVIVVPANWPKSRETHWKSLLIARAIENQCYIIGVNCVGEMNGLEYSGGSMIVTPNGEIIAELFDAEGLVIADINCNTAQIRKEFPVKNDCNWKLYNQLYERIKK